MTGPVTFGDLLDAAREHLGRAGAAPGWAGGQRDLLDVTRGMHDLVTVIGRFLRDDISGQGSVAADGGEADDREAASPWPAARAQARRAAALAARLLRPAVTIGRSAPVRVSERGRHLDAAVRALAAGGDLLATHVTSGRDGARSGRSAWAPAARSAEAGRAVTVEMAELARQAAALGMGLVAAQWAGSEETRQARKDLAGACQNLRLLAGAVMAARRQEPVPAGDRELLRAIPAAVAPPRRLPDGSEQVAALCQGVAGAAERLRQSAVDAAGLAGWSPSVSAGSLRHAAAASVAVSHHCAMLLRAVADRCGAAAGPDAGTGHGLSAAAVAGEAAQATARGRDGWLKVAQALEQVVCDLPGHVSQDAEDVQDLALWTGRLAYADPRWTLVTGPRAAARPAADLAPGPEEAAAVVAAVHHASESLARLADAHGRQARAAAQAGRFLVPARTLPDYLGITVPYGPAPPDRIYLVRSAYWRAREASAGAEARIARVAEITRAPSAVLARVRELAARARRPAADPQAGVQGPKAALVGEATLPEPLGAAGLVEWSLRVLGVTDPDQLRHAIDVDRAGEQMIADAATGRPPRPDRLAELAASVREIPRHWREAGIRGRVLVLELEASSPRDAAERQAE